MTTAIFEVQNSIEMNKPDSITKQTKLFPIASHSQSIIDHLPTKIDSKSVHRKSKIHQHLCSLCLIKGLNWKSDRIVNIKNDLMYILPNILLILHTRLDEKCHGLSIKSCMYYVERIYQGPSSPSPIKLQISEHSDKLHKSNVMRFS